jgi:hypothetical protein
MKHTKTMSRSGCLLIAIVLATAAGCGRGSKANFDLTGTEGTVIYESEKAFSSTVVGDRYRIYNNPWNAKASGGNYRQKIYVKDVNGKPVFGWAWRWWDSKGAVVSYPEIQVGDSPWAGLVSENSGFPFRIGTKKLTVDYDIEMQASGQYNLAFEFWTISSPPANKNKITHEVMIWVAGSRLSPAGSLVATVPLAGNTFRVFFGGVHGDDSGNSSNTWTIISLVAEKPMLHGPLDVGAIIDYLVQTRMLDKNTYVACLELGNEISVGSGKTEVRNYNVRLE